MFRISNIFRAFRFKVSLRFFSLLERARGSLPRRERGSLLPVAAASFSYLFFDNLMKNCWNLVKFWWKFDENLVKIDEKSQNLDRPVLVRINEFLNFFFEFVERVLLIRSFLKTNAKIRKKEREKNLNENHDFSDQKISIFAEKNAKIFFCTISKI